MTFAATLKNLRNQANITQVEMSKITGISQSAIAMYESGRREPNFETLEMLSSFFNVPIGHLLGDKENSNHGTCASDKYTWLHGLVEDVLQDEPAVLAVLESSAPYVAGSVGGAAKDVLRSSLRLVTDSMASYDASPGVPIRGEERVYEE